MDRNWSHVDCNWSHVDRNWSHACTSQSQADRRRIATDRKRARADRSWITTYLSPWHWIASWLLVHYLKLSNSWGRAVRGSSSPTEGLENQLRRGCTCATGLRHFECDVTLLVLFQWSGVSSSYTIDNTHIEDQLKLIRNWITSFLPFQTSNIISGHKNSAKATA